MDEIGSKYKNIKMYLFKFVCLNLYFLFQLQLVSLKRTSVNKSNQFVVFWFIMGCFRDVPKNYVLGGAAFNELKNNKLNGLLWDCYLTVKV